MGNTSFTTADLATFCGLDDLGLAVCGQHLSVEHAGRGGSPGGSRCLVPRLRLSRITA